MCMYMYMTYIVHATEGNNDHVICDNYLWVQNLAILVLFCYLDTKISSHKCMHVHVYTVYYQIAIFPKNSTSL